MDTDVNHPDVMPPELERAHRIAGMMLARYQKQSRELMRIHVRQWFEFLLTNGVRDPMNVTRGHIEAWARYLEEEMGRKPATVCTKLNAVCMMYKLAHVDGFIPTNPAVNVRRPKIEYVSTTRSLGRSQFADMLVYAETHGHPGDHVLVCLLGLSGLRIGEALAANVTDLGQERGFSTLHLPQRKGGKTATISLATRTAWAIREYVGDRTTGPLLLGRNGLRLERKAAARTIKRMCRGINVDPPITPHGLRHTFTTLALDAGVPERDIIDSGGWSDARMVQYYDRNRGQLERNATHAVAALVGGAG